MENEIWSIVLSLEGLKPICCKWLFKIKWVLQLIRLDFKGKWNLSKPHKFRLIAKGFTKKEDIDYKEHFLSILNKTFF